ncbi:unnamed protein product [Acanthoscelides obtectus]|uniref:Uncharacterized protein n=1 Tax=Acanthoscelides obtectus TaxID=200917 RepID=A0A9P0NVF9_ACAOB|nr:unnamed protein product [Acanthoscelides obtectus]CAK1625803.1 hypothetical protein AOBTE_LOCUS3409 [Acanthoscelides obtectus]
MFRGGSWRLIIEKLVDSFRFITVIFEILAFPRTRKGEKGGCRPLDSRKTINFLRGWSYVPSILEKMRLFMEVGDKRHSSGMRFLSSLILCLILQ